MVAVMGRPTRRADAERILGEREALTRSGGGARVAEKAARVRIHFASACPNAALFRLLAGRLATSGP